jgi:hypothetical protein
MTTFSSTDLEAYLDDALPLEEMARIEKAMREQPTLAKQLAEVQQRRDAGLHSLGDIWRRHRLSCPSREQLGDLLSGKLSADQSDYARFHVEVIGCYYCQANLADLRRQSTEATDAVRSRQRKYFQSSAGLLRRKP